MPTSDVINCDVIVEKYNQIVVLANAIVTIF